MTESPLSVLRQLVAILVIAGLPHAAASQHRSLRFQHLTSEDGLPQNMVDCMLQDHQGFMWFGTWNGLSRYDGYTFEVFDEGTSNKALSSNFIYSLLEDDFGNIWIGTHRGLYLYLYDKGLFVPAIPENGDSLHFQGTVNHLQRVGSAIWVATELGVFEINVQNESGGFSVNRQYLFGTDPSEISATIVRAFLQVDDQVWLGSDQGIYMIKKDHTFSNIRFDSANSSSLSSDIVTSMYLSKDRGIWVGTDVGLNQYSKEGFTRYYFDPLDETSVVHNTIMDIKEDQDGSLVIATLGGLSFLKRGSSAFENYYHEANRQNSLNNNFINCLYLDTQSNLWIGTERGGVNFLSANQNTFEHFEHELGNVNSLSNNTVNAIFEDENYIWIGTAGGGLNRFDKQSRGFKHYANSPGDATSLSSNFVTHVFRDARNQLWVTTWGLGLNKLIDEGTKTERFEHFENGQYPGLISNFISSVVVDPSGVFWVGTLHGLVVFDQDKRTFSLVKGGNGQVQITGVGCLAFENEQTLWVGTRTGLHRLNLSGGAMKVDDFRQSHEAGSLSGNYVISAFKDANGAMWFGTYGQGLNRLIVKGNEVRFEQLTTADGLGNGIIYGIQQDHAGQLWLSTDYGLSRVDPETNRVRNFYINDGLLNNQYYWSAAYKNASGKLYFGGMNGLDTFYPEWIRENQMDSRVIITDIKLLNESVIPGKEYNGVEVLQESVSKSNSITLSYKEKIFAIEFSSFNYREPNQIQYAYMLEGFDVKWNQVDAQRRFANYTNLKPGNYVFKVKAAGLEDGLDEPITTLKIRINPPFWATTWFKVVGSFLLIGAVMGYIRLRTLTLKRQKMVLERQVAERTERINQQNEALSFQAVQLQKSNKELEQKQEQIEGQNHQLENQNKEILSQRDELIYLNDKLNTVNQLKLSFFTNISHEFRTPLTLILGPLERLLKDRGHTQETQGSLSIIQRNAQRLLHLVNQIMDFRKIEQGRMELNVRKGDLKSFCTNIFEAFQPLAEIKKVNFQLSVEELPKEIWFDHQVIENILYNLLSNAFKYTPDEGNVRMEVKAVSIQDSRLNELKYPDAGGKTIISIKISDTGIGISEENLPLVFKRFYRITSEESLKISGSGIGLALTEELTKTHHGEIFVESTLGKGSDFEVQFPGMRGAYQNSDFSESQHDHSQMKRQVEVLTQEFIPQVNDQDDPEWVYDKTRATVLVVEDNVDLRTFITHRLNKLYNIYEAANGVEGLKIAQKVDPDLIISDVMMPKMDGLELCASIKNNLDTSHIPIILLTAKNSVENQLEGLHVGADDYLPKPFNFEILEARVSNLIETRNKLRTQFLGKGELNLDELTSSNRDQKFLELALRTVDQHMENSDFGVTMFVNEMGISRSLLHKKLTVLTNQSAADFINHLRLKKAENLLLTTELNVSQVAYSVGYSDPKYFTRLFHKQYGASPKEFVDRAKNFINN